MAAIVLQYQMAYKTEVYLFKEEPFLFINHFESRFLSPARGSQGNNEVDEEGCKLFVHGIKQDVREEAIKELFRYNLIESTNERKRITHSL